MNDTKPYYDKVIPDELMDYIKRTIKIRLNYKYGMMKIVDLDEPEPDQERLG